MAYFEIFQIKLLALEKSPLLASFGPLVIQ